MNRQPLSRQVEITGGAVRIVQRTCVTDKARGIDVSGPACLYAHLRVAAGTIEYAEPWGCRPAPCLFELFVPPFCIVSAALDRCDVHSVGIAFRTGVPPPTATAVLCRTSRGPAETVDEALARWDAASGCLGQTRRVTPIRHSRRAILIATDAGRALTVGALDMVILARPEFVSQHIAVVGGVAILAGVMSALFAPAAGV